MSTSTEQNSSTSSRSSRRTQTAILQVNVVALGITLALGLLLAISAYALHGFQMRRIAGAFLDQAERYEEQSEWRESADYLFRYLRLKPEDAAASARLAEAYDKSATIPAMKTRSIELYRRALGLAGEELAAEKKDKLQRRLVELLIEQQRFNEAEKECNNLLAGPGGADDPEVHRQLAHALYGQHLLGELVGLRSDGVSAGAAFERAVQLNPRAGDMSATWALILRDKPLLLSDEQRERWPSRPDRVAHADQVMDQLVTNNPTDGEVYLARYLYREEHQLPDSESDLNQALALRHPEDTDTLLIAA
ncbi:MAG: hypothetical protein ABI619_13945, partial [Betaproteobacteria bacterium]